MGRIERERKKKGKTETDGLSNEVTFAATFTIS